MDYLLPEGLIPGRDSISKAVLTGDKIINIICNSPQDHYMTAPSKLWNKSAYDILYHPKVALSKYMPHSSRSP